MARVVSGVLRQALGGRRGAGAVPVERRQQRGQPLAAAPRARAQRQAALLRRRRAAHGPGEATVYPHLYLHIFRRGPAVSWTLHRWPPALPTYSRAATRISLPICVWNRFCYF